MTTIDTKIRITALADQAIKQIRDLKKAVDDAGAGNANKAAATAAAGAAAAARTTAQAGAQAQRSVQQVAEQTTKSLAQTRNEMRQLGPQLTDIAVGLSTGQSPFTVLLQQGGQLKDVFGGIRPAIAALATVITPVRIAIGGLLGVVAALGLSTLQTRRENQELNRALAVTGNVAGTTADQVNTLAERIGAQQRATISDARETLTQLIATGRVTNETMGSAASAVLALARLTGRSADDVVKDFEDQAKGVTDWARKQDSAYSFLTATELQHIKSLEAQGNASEAIIFVNQKLADTVDQRVRPAMGFWATLTRDLAKELRDVRDLMSKVFAEPTLLDKIDVVKKQIAELEAALGLNRNPNKTIAEPFKGQLDALKNQLALYQAQVSDINDGTKLDAQVKANDNKVKLQQTKEYLSALEGLNEASARASLEKLQSSLDLEQVAVERSHDLGLLSERGYFTALAFVEKQRLQAQEAFVKRQIEIVSGQQIAPDTAEAVARDKRLQELATELSKVRGQIATTSAQTISKGQVQALEESKIAAAEYVSIWQRAAGRIRDLVRINAASRASRTLDPEQRAAAEAEIRTEQLKTELAAQRRELENSIATTKDAGQRAAFEEQLRVLNAEAEGAIAAEAAAARFTSLSQQIAEKLERIRNLEAGIEQQVEAGVLTVEQAERRKNEVRQASIEKLTELSRLQAENARTPAERNQADGARLQIDAITRSTDKARDAARGALSNGFSQFFSDVVSGAKTAKEAFADFLKGIAQAALNIIAQRLGAQLAESLIPKGNGSGSGGGDFYAAIGNFIASFFHTGGIVGATGGVSRSIPAAAFAYAPRYHSGGVAGLRRNEVPAVLLQGEEVLTEDDPRHRKNMAHRRMGGNGVETTVNVSVSVPQGTSGAEAEKMGNELGRAVEAKVHEVITNQLRPGGVLSRR
jgi:phage-related minor tail protein